MSEFMEVALKAVKNAEEIILKYYSEPITVQTKADASPVTIADQEAEQIIRQTILEAFPDHLVYGEEGDKTAGGEDQYTWVVDPIDGTKSFIRHHGLFGTLLALYHGGELILGVSNMPVINECMHAEKGQGAFLNNHPVQVSSVDDMSEAFMTFGSVKYFTRIKKQKALLGLSEQIKWARGIGDCWGYHLLAQGKVDIVAEGSVKIWDVAALKIIVEEAGGEVTELDGSPLGFNSSNILATNGKLHQPTVQAFAATDE